MAALTSDRNTKRRDGRGLTLPMAGATTIHLGAIVCVNASGFAVPGSASATLKPAGVAFASARNPGSAGAERVKVDKTVACFANSAAADAITLADIGADCYIVDDQTVAKTSATNTRSVAGKVFDVDAEGVWVDFR
ncbi:hypothetical protein [Comamonas aquatica]|uniref:hypothetical protein n=1 Tax=Comamonas aquatica TaxID=225991 RepID=UPI00244BEB31|nr:hypothetical protein [Comamonas aquatica]MDH0494253.1 hypothetical protein [Comamonas aquatica]